MRQTRSHITAATRRAASLLAGAMVLASPWGLAGEPVAFPHTVPMVESGSGVLNVAGSINGEPARFLLDTGATMVTVSRELFERFQAHTPAEPVRRVAGRLASGRIEVMQVYRVEHLRLGESCDLGPVEVGVMKRGGRNLLGLSALSRAAPFAVSTSPPALSLSRCAAGTAVAGL